MDNYLFTWDHLLFVILGLCSITVLCLLFKKYGKGKELNILKWAFWILFILEVMKIFYHILVLKAPAKNWIPLYFCSLVLYACGFASYGKGKIKKMGECFLVYGGIVAGTIFIIYPATALGLHPLFHFLTIHSLFYHVSCVFLGLMLLMHNYYEISHNDIIDYALFVGIYMLFAQTLNVVFSTNFMFLKESGDILPLSFLYTFVGAYFYPLCIAIGQLVCTFYITYVSCFVYRKVKFKNL